MTITAIVNSVIVAAVLFGLAVSGIWLSGKSTGVATCQVQTDPTP